MWKYTDSTRQVVFRVLSTGGIESHLVSTQEIQDWLAAGNTILDPDPPPPPTQDELDSAAAKQYQKLVALKNMTPAQVEAWVDANITNFAQAKDAIKTLAIAVSILARRI